MSLSLTLPTVPPSSVIEYKTVIPYSALNTPTQTFRYVIFGIPQNYVVCAAAMRLLTTFNGPGLTSITGSIGGFVPNSNTANITYYLGSYELTQQVTSQSVAYSGPPSNNLADSSTTYTTPAFASPVSLFYNGPHDIAAYFVAQGIPVNQLSTGQVEVAVQIRPM